jgi:hypothetical protein
MVRNELVSNGGMLQFIKGDNVTTQLLALLSKKVARVYLKAPGALIWAFGDMTHLRYF